MNTVEDAAFLAAIRADADDETARLAYADWLEERGDPDGELVRLVCQLRREWFADGPAWRRLEQLGGRRQKLIGSLDERSQRLLACDYAERVLPLIEGRLSWHRRPRQALNTARRFAVGQVTQEKLLAQKSGLWITGRWQWRGSDWSVIRTALTAIEGMIDGDAVVTAREVRTALGKASAAGRPAKFAERRRQLCRAVEYRLGFVGTC
jgi:uncharacterized protein (TIGR02996 family)